MPLKRLWFVFVLFVCALGAQATPPSAQQLLEKSPIVFERNDGQSSAGHDFLARGVGYAFELHATGAVMHVGGSVVEPLTMTLSGARHDAPAVPSDPAHGVTNYYRGSSRVVGVPSFGRVTYDDVYEGIDVAYYGAGRTLEYDFVIAPGADPSRIAIDFAGVDGFCIEDDGSLVLTTGFGDVRHQTPYAYQERAGVREQVAAHFVVEGERIRFEVAGYDRDRELVIDPRVVYNYNLPEEIYPTGVAVDGSGNVIVVASTHIPDVPLVNEVSGPSLLRTTGYSFDAVVLKYSPAGLLVYATYLGGFDEDEARAVTVDAAGNAYILGETQSTNFPVSAGAYQPYLSLPMVAGYVMSPAPDVFVTKLAPSGALVYSTYLGGAGDEDASDIVVDGAGSAVVAGTSSSPSFPGTLNAGAPFEYEGLRGFVTKVSPDGASLVYSTLLSHYTKANGVALDETGAVYVVGDAQDGLITTPGVVKRDCFDRDGNPDGCLDAFVAKLDTNGSVELATYLGGSDYDFGVAIAVDASHDIYVAGTTQSYDFPVTPDAVDPEFTHRIPEEAFYVRLNSDASIIEYSTFFGGSHWNWSSDIALDNAGRAVLLVKGSGDGFVKDDLGHDGTDYLVRFDTSNAVDFSTRVRYAERVAIGQNDAIYLGWADTIRKLDPDSHSPLVVRSFWPAGRSNVPDRRFGMGLDAGELSPSASMTIGSVPVTDVEFDPHSATGTMPILSSGTHDVTVTTGGHTSTLYRAFEQAPGELGITGVSPLSVRGGRGAAITVTGTGFPAGAGVVLGDIRTDGVITYGLPTVRVNATTLRAFFVDAVPPGVYDVNVLVDSEWSAVTLESALTVNALPGVFGFHPLWSPASGGYGVTVESHEMLPEGGTTTSFDGLVATPTSYHASGVNVIAPSHVPGRVPIEVTTAGGTTTLPGFLYVADVGITSITPNSGAPEGGTPFTISGSGFLPGARVTIDGLLIPDASVASSTTITGTTPPLHPGSYSVSVRNPDGGFASLGDGSFTYEGPVVTGAGIYGTAGFAYPPRTAPSSGGVEVRVYGRGFDATSSVYFGLPGQPDTNIQAPVTGFDQSLRVLMPPHPEGPVDVTVVNSDGTKGVLVGQFRIVAPDGPAITSVSPTYGPLSGGTAITITGSGFAPGAHVTIDDQYVRNLVVTPTQITGTTPRGSFAAARQLRVVNPDYRSATASFTYIAPPSIAAVTPAAGPTSGGTMLQITGSNFDVDATVTIGGVERPNDLWESSGLIWAGTPAHASGDVDITVTNADGQSATKTNAFRFLPPAPTITSFTPDHAAPGNPVVITGTNFEYVQSVTFFDGRAAEFTVDSTTQITALVPSQSADGPITITAQSGVGVSATNFIVDSTAPEITSFTPSGGSSGDIVTITGLRFTGATAVKFGTLNAVFTLDSETQITATVPANPKTGKIAVSSPTGTGMSETSFLVPPRFTGTPFSPSYALPGAVITVNGANFEGTTEVSFNGSPATTYSVNAAATAITVTVPAGATTGFVTVIAQGGTVTSTIAFVVPPQVDSFTPASGDPGTPVVLTGARFTGATKVTFGGVTAASFTVDGPTQITAISSATAKSGPLCVTVSSRVGCSATDYTFPPRFSTSPFSPASALPGTSVKINGINFQGTTAVSFNGIAQPAFTVNTTGTTITLDVPAGATTGPVSVTTPVGTATSDRNFGVPAEITSFDPAQGPEGTSVALTGVRFTGATAVKFGGVAATTFAVANDTAMTATVPANAKTGTICVTTPGGTGCSATSFSATPRITSFSPPNALPGAAVEIRGTSFAGTTVVSFNGELASPFTVDPAGTKITTTVPMSARTGPVTVTTPVGSFTSTTNFGVRPEVTSFSPAEGDPGSIVTITGVRFTDATAVRFGATNGATSSSITVVSDTEVTAVVPLSGKSGIICVTTPGGQGCSTESFVMPPRVTSFSPASALPLAAVTINGLNFQDVTSVVFSNGVAQPDFTVDGAGTKITTTVPAGAITGPVTVTTPSGTHVSTVLFKVPPAVTGFTPATGDVGDVVTIQGVRFEGATAVQFGGTSGGSSTSFTATDTTIEAVVPATGKSGTICVTTPGGKACSETSFSMPPRVTSFSPANALPGMSITITGANFEEASAVSFNGVSATPFTVNATATTITVAVPEGATTGPVSVTTPQGTGTSTTSFGVRPEVTSFAPASGMAGDTVTITGVRLDGTTGVKFDGIAASTFANVSSTSVTAVVPATATIGTICVTTAGGSGCSATDFIVGPGITGFSPTKALPGASVSITGANFQNATAVAFNGVAQPTFTVNATGSSITTTVPTGASTGTISVTTPAGSATSASVFGVYATIAGFTPASGGPGTSVVITGERLGDASAVKFNGVTASFTVDDATTITAIVPPTATTGKISVTTVAGAVSSADTFTVGAKISSFSPNKGAPGDAITINGSSFTGATAVSFNGVPATSFTVNSASSIAAVVPSGATTGPVTVTTPSGSGTSAALFYLPAAITSFTPVSGASGTVVTLNGVNFTGATAVRFNGVLASVTPVSNTQLTATVPATATSGPISIQTPHSTVSSGASFTVLAAPAPVLQAVATTATSVAITWTGSAAVQYDVQRASTHNGMFSTLMRVTGVAFNDATVSAGTTSFYRVVRVTDGVISNSDHATTVIFADDPLVAGVTMKAAHVTQLRNGVNAMRLAVGLGAVSWTDPGLTTGGSVRLAYLTELRSALSAAMSALGRPITFGEPSLTTGSVVKAGHFQELRDALK